MGHGNKHRRNQRQKQNAMRALQSMERKGEILWNPVYGEFYSEPEPEEYLILRARPFRVHVKIHDVEDQIVRLTRIENAASPTEARRRTTEFMESNLDKSRFQIVLVASDGEYWYDLALNEAKNDH